MLRTNSTALRHLKESGLSVSQANLQQIVERLKASNKDKKDKIQVNNERLDKMYGFGI